MTYKHWSSLDDLSRAMHGLTVRHITPEERRSVAQVYYHNNIQFLKLNSDTDKIAIDTIANFRNSRFINNSTEGTMSDADTIDKIVMYIMLSVIAFIALIMAVMLTNITSRNDAESIYETGSGAKSPPLGLHTSWLCYPTNNPIYCVEARYAGR